MRLEISEARKQFNTLDKLLKTDTDHTLRITRHGREIFAVVDIDYLNTLLEAIEIMADKKSHALLMQSIDDIRNLRLHDHADVEKEFG